MLGVPDAVHMQLCIGTSLAIMAPTNIRSYLTHRATGAVLTDVVRQWTPAVIVGIAIGSLIATVAPSPVFKIAFIVIAGDHRRQAPVRAGALATRRRSAQASAGAPLWPGGGPDGVAHRRERRLALHDGADALRQADPSGGGDLGRHRGADHARRHRGLCFAGLPHQAQLPPLSIGFVSLIGFALMAPVSCLAAPYGARLAHALSKRVLEVAFGLFLLAASLRFLVSLVW